MQYWFEALILGLSLALLVGPILIAQFSGVLHDGLKGGMIVGIGVWVSDIIYIIITYLVLINLKNIEISSISYQTLGWIGGALLVLMGIRNFFKSGVVLLDNERKKHIIYSKHFTKGFLINTLNPFTVLFWLATLGHYIMVKRVAPEVIVLIAGTILCCIILTDSLKVYFMSKLNGKFISDNLLTINKISGVALIVFGIILFFRSQTL
ncbi:MAG: LysE family transporter [Saprospiraceae bacterium]